MNGAALWMFGTAIERAAGWWRMLICFLVAGTTAMLSVRVPAVSMCPSARVVECLGGRRVRGGDLPAARSDLCADAPADVLMWD